MSNLSALYQDPQFQALTEDKKSNVIVGIVGKDPDFQKLPDDRKAYVLNGIMAKGREQWTPKKATEQGPKGEGKSFTQGPSPKLVHEVPGYSLDTLQEFSKPISGDDAITGMAQKKQQYQKDFQEIKTLAASPTEGMKRLTSERLSIEKQLANPKIAPEQRRDLQIRAAALQDYKQTLDTNIVDALGEALPLAPIKLQAMVTSLTSLAKGGLAHLAEKLGKSAKARQQAVNDLIDHGHDPEHAKTAVDTVIEAKSKPAMGPVERTMPTEKEGLTPAKSEHVWQATSRQHDKTIAEHFPKEEATPKESEVPPTNSETPPSILPETPTPMQGRRNRRRRGYPDEGAAREVSGVYKGERGIADPALLLHITGAAGGAALDPGHPLEGAALGLSITGLAHFGVGKFAKLAKERNLDLSALAEKYTPDLTTITSPKQLSDAFFWAKASSHADSAVISQHIDSAVKNGVTKEVDQMFRDASEGSIKLNPKGQVLYDKTVQPLRDVVNSIRAKYGNAADMAIKDLGTRIALNHRTWLDAMLEGGAMDSRGGAQRLFAPKSGATKARTVFATDDGHIVTTKKIKGAPGYVVTFWKDGETVGTRIVKEKPSEGAEVGSTKLRQAKQKDIEQHSPVRYVQSDLAVWGLRAKEMLKYDRDQRVLKGILESKGPDGTTLFPHIDEGAHNIPPDFRQLKGDAAAIPQFQGRYMPANLAEVIEDMAKANKSGIGHLVNDVVIRTMMVNFFPHVMNEFVHWWDARGLSGMLSPMGIPGGASKGLVGFAKTFPDALRSVITMDKFQTDMMRHGGALMAPSRREAANMDKILQYGMKEAMKSGSMRQIAQAVGMSPFRLMKKISDGSSSIMWGIRDLFYTQLVKEQVLMGKDMRSAIQEVDRHMPPYRIPSRVLGSRGVSQLMQNPLVVFSAYHHNMLSSLGEMAKEIASPAIKGHSNEFVKGLDRAMALTAAMAVIFPMADAILTKSFGKDGEKITQRRAGPLHPIEGVEKFAEDPTYNNLALVGMGILTPSPMLTMAPELFYNRSGFSGKPIMKPGTEVQDALRYAASKLHPVDAAMKVQEGKRSTEAALLNVLDIITKTKKQQQFEENLKAIHRAQRAAARQ